MSVSYTYEEALAASLEYFDNDELAAKVFVDKYALRDGSGVLLEKTPDDMHDRIATEFACIEKKKFKAPLSFSEIRSAIDHFMRIVPQGSPMFAIGNPYQYASLSNCFTVDPPQDSYGAIMRADEELVQISKRRGGVGIDISNIRPVDTPTMNSARTSTGILPFMDRYSNSIREVGQSGRRGALMITLSIHHPEVLRFAHAKDDPGKVTGANLSIRITDEFMLAVKNNTSYEQRWPVDSKTPTISKMVSAREVWLDIITCAHRRAEPGILFWSHIQRESPADCYEQFITICTNPCSELPLAANDSCRLLLLNLLTYVVHPFIDGQSFFDYGAFRQDAIIAQRLMDDIVDLELEAIDRIISKVESDPEPGHIKASELSLWSKIRRMCQQGRRTGTGITALGDTLAALGIKYGSDQSIETTGEIYKVLKLACYRSSVDMAKELGSFPVWDHHKEEKNPFLLRIKEEDPALYKDMRKFGRRNIALLTTAPAGTVSIETQTSSGIEPVFMTHYKRRKKITPGESDARVDFTDASGDKWSEFVVYHPGVTSWMNITGETDITKSPYHEATAEEINWRQRVRLQAIANTHVDHSISSTLNLPEDVTVAQVAEIYETAWEAGCKGITVYRKGCRDGVLVEVDKAPERSKGVVTTEAPKRPKALKCDIHHTTCGGKKFVVCVGMLPTPYEVIAWESEQPLHQTHGELVRVKRGHYRLVDVDGVTVLADNITEQCGEDQEALLRMISTSLRHGAEIKFVADQVAKVRGDLYSFARGLARVLKKYIPEGTKVSGETCGECGQDSLCRSEGCISCKNCGWSKCA